MSYETENQENQKIQDGLEKWRIYAKKVFLEDWEEYVRTLFMEEDGQWDQFIQKLKLKLSAFIRGDEIAGSMTREEQRVLYDEIKEFLMVPDQMMEFLGIPAVDTKLEVNSSPIPNCRLKKPIGSGGFGSVWEAEAPGGVAVALKFLKKENRYSPEQKSGNSRKISASTPKRSELEALRIIKNIKHANLVPITAIWAKTNPRYTIYQMALSDSDLPCALGISASGHSGEASFSGRSISELLPYFRDVAAALDCLNHPENPERPAVMHGDVKPGNIFVTNGSAQLGDFGSVCLVSQQLPTPLTPGFGAPERLDGKISVHSDQFSLAVSWYYLRTGKLPYPVAELFPKKEKTIAEREKLEENPIAKLETIKIASIPKKNARSEEIPEQPEISEEALREIMKTPDLSLLPRAERAILAKAMDPDPEKRFASNSDFIEALAKKRNLWPWISLAILALFAVAFLVSFNFQKEKERSIAKKAALQEYVSVSTQLSKEMEGQFLTFQNTMIPTAEDLLKKWDELIERYSKEPLKRKWLVDDFVSELDSHITFWQNHMKKEIPAPNQEMIDVLRKNDAPVEEYLAYYSMVYPALVTRWETALQSLKLSAQSLAVSEIMIPYWKEMGIFSLRNALNYLDSCWCAHLELLTTAPKETGKNCRQFIHENGITLCENISTELTAKEYLDRQNQIMEETKIMADQINTDELEKEIERLLDDLEKNAHLLEELEKNPEGLLDELQESEKDLKPETP